MLYFEHLPFKSMSCFWYLMTSSYLKLWLKVKTQNRTSLRVLSMGGDFFLDHALTWQRLSTFISADFTPFPLKLKYVVAQTINCSHHAFYILKSPHEVDNYVVKNWKWECNLYGTIGDCCLQLYIGRIHAATCGKLNSAISVNSHDCIIKNWSFANDLRDSRLA